MIDHIIFDIDGTLTDAGIVIHSDGTESKRFNAQDGQIINALYKLGYKTIFLTQRDSDLINMRAAEINVHVVLKGVRDKEKLLKTYVEDNNLKFEQFAYVGDDLNDYKAMRLCAFKACPVDAVTEIRGLCDFVSAKKGGHGAVRDICEHLLKKQNHYDLFLNLFGIESM